MAEETQARTWTEAPVSATLRCYLRSYDVLLTLRADSGQELLPKLDLAITWLEQHGATPTITAANGTPAEETRVCPLHGAKMSKHTKNDDTWWSHKAYRPDGTEHWCRGSAEQ